MSRNFVDGSKTRGGKAYRQSESFKDLIRWRDNFTCQNCGRFGWDVSHIISYADGGYSVPENMRVLCHSCNCSTRRPPQNARLPLYEYYRRFEVELASERVRV